MNPLWLLVIVPVSAAVGAVMMSLLVTAKQEDEDMEIFDDDE